MIQQPPGDSSSKMQTTLFRHVHIDHQFGVAFQIFPRQSNVARSKKQQFPSLVDGECLGPGLGVVDPVHALPFTT